MRRTLLLTCLVTGPWLGLCGAAQAQGAPDPAPAPEAQPEQPTEPEPPAPAPQPAPTAPPPAAPPPPATGAPMYPPGQTTNTAPRAAQPGAGPGQSVGPITEPLPPPRRRKQGKRHDGFYFRGVMGVAHLTGRVELDTPLATADQPETDVDMSGTGIAFDLMFGGTLSGWVLGGGLWATGTPEPDIEPDIYSDERQRSLNLGVIGPFVDWYPDEEGGFHAGVILGFAGFTLTEDRKDDPLFESGGGALGAIIGYDFWVSREWSLGLLARGFVYAGENDDKDKATAQSLGVAGSVLFH